MKYAIVQSGGNQYRCEEGATVQVQRLAVEAGSSYAFDQVLLVSDGDAVKVGAPHVSGATVTATVVGEAKGEKTYSFRYKPKERQRSGRSYSEHDVSALRASGAHGLIARAGQGSRAAPDNRSPHSGQSHSPGDR